MKFLKKVSIGGLFAYLLGWLLLIINGMNTLEVLGHSLCFAGIFSFSTIITLILNKK